MWGEGRLLPHALRRRLRSLRFTEASPRHVCAAPRVRRPLHSLSLLRVLLSRTNRACTSPTRWTRPPWRAAGARPMPTSCRCVNACSARCLLLQCCAPHAASRRPRTCTARPVALATPTHHTKHIADAHLAQRRRQLGARGAARLVPLGGLQHVQAGRAGRPVPPAPARPHLLVCARG